jgi:hypothetical protein
MLGGRVAASLVGLPRPMLSRDDGPVPVAGGARWIGEAATGMMGLLDTTGRLARR